MRDPLKYGTHSWEQIIEYFRCKKCGFINESRTDYVSRRGEWQKDLSCKRCHHRFTVTKFERKQLGPLFSPL